MQPLSSREMLKVFRTAPVHDKNEAPVLNELGEHVNKLVYKFSFQWTRMHFDNKLGSYVWKKGEIGVKDQESFVVLTTFVARIPRVQQVGRGGKLVMEKNGKVIYDPGLIVVKELLESEDLVKYLGI